MENLNKLNEVPLAKINSNELQAIKELEEKLGNKYYLIAFDKSNNMKGKKI